MSTTPVTIQLTDDEVAFLREHGHLYRGLTGNSATILAKVMADLPLDPPKPGEPVQRQAFDGTWVRETANYLATIVNARGETMHVLDSAIGTYLTSRPIRKAPR